MTKTPAITPNKAASRYPQPRPVTPGQALRWLSGGWQGFVAQPLQWLLMALISFALMVLLSLVIVPLPIIGPVAAPVAFQLLLGGMLVAARRQEEGASVRFADLFEGGAQHAANLALLALFFCAPLVIMSLVTLIALGGGLLVGAVGAALGGALAGLINAFFALITFIATGWMLSLLLLLIMLMALIYAPALIMFNNCPPLAAMRLSFRASVMNAGATLLAALLIGLLFVLALVPAGLGVVVLIPVCVIALRRAYVDIFTSAPPALAAPHSESV